MFVFPTISVIDLPGDVCVSCTDNKYLHLLRSLT